MTDTHDDATRADEARRRAVVRERGGRRVREAVAADVRPGADEWVAAPPDRPVLVTDALTDVLSDFDDLLWASQPAQVQLDMMRSLARLRSTLDAVELAVVAGIETSQAARTESWASTKDFVTAVTGGRKGAGRAAVALAEALAGDRSLTRHHLAAGLISRAQADVVVDAVSRLPVDPGLREAAERLLLTEAATHDATDLARRGRYVLERLDPDGSEAREERALSRVERSAHLGRFLSISEDGLGGVRLKGRGTVEDAAWIKNALFPLAAPVPAASTATASTATAGTTREGPGGAACSSRVGDPEGGCGLDGCAHDGRDPRDHGARLWDALVEASRRLAGADLLPDSHGATPRITVTVGFDQLTGALSDRSDLATGRRDETASDARPVLGTGEPLSVSAVRRLACDAEILPMVLGSRSQVLDVGRTSRLVTLGLWLALVARDRHCAFPGCSRPPIACDAHHVRHWADGGATSLSNLVLLCRSHHTALHTTPWRVHLDPDDGRPVFTPPPHLRRPDRPPDPLRRRPLRL